MNRIEIVALVVLIISCVCLVVIFVISFQLSKKEKEKQKELQEMFLHLGVQKNPINPNNSTEPPYYGIFFKIFSILMLISVMILLPVQGEQSYGTEFTVALSAFKFGQLLLHFVGCLLITSIVGGITSLTFATIISGIVSSIKKKK